jgi:FAD/FMN-containing dehydrogenase
MKRREFVASAGSVLTVLAAGAVPATGIAGKQVVLSASDIADLRASLRGQLLTPGQDGYDSARRIWNGAFDKNPALIARCAQATDVSQTVKFARAHGLLVAVRGGGHSLSGQSVCDGGLMIDLSPMQGVQVDPQTKRASAQPGVLLGHFDRETQAHGLATTAGTVSHTGVAGLTLGGGMGRLARKFGYTCDNLLSVDIVTADGRLVKASAHDNPDLFWGLRGGGGNFGVVTSFEYQLHEVAPAMIGGMLIFPFVNARELIGSFADFIDGASDEMYCDCAIVTGPNGQRVIALNACHSGTTAAAEKELAQLRKIGKPIQDGLGASTYVTRMAAATTSSPDSFARSRRRSSTRSWAIWKPARWPPAS